MLSTFYYLFFKNVCCESFHKTAKLQSLCELQLNTQQVIKTGLQRLPTFTEVTLDDIEHMCQCKESRNVLPNCIS